LDDLAVGRQQQYGSEEERKLSYCHCDSNYNDTSPSNKPKATFHPYLLLFPIKSDINVYIRNINIPIIKYNSTMTDKGSLLSRAFSRDG
jgi:hypothetical protein